MINPAEHLYDDDPFCGPADVRTRLEGVSYFFLGNGYIQAAVQWAPRGEGTPLALLVMDPDRMRKKRESLTLDERTGLRPTAIRIFCDGRSDSPRPDSTHVEWAWHEGVPAVEARWSCDRGSVHELFYCPDQCTPRLVRQVTLSGPCETDHPLRLVTGGGPVPLVDIPLRFGSESVVTLLYELDPNSGSVSLRRIDGPVPVDRSYAAAVERRTQVHFGHELLDTLWNRSVLQLAASVSAKGRVDASVWQYNREWVRDQAHMVLAMLLAGDQPCAALMLRRLLREFVTPQGATMDSSEVRDSDETELDQNGLLLHTLREYVLWTGDLALVHEWWDRIKALAEFPLGAAFAHPFGMLANRREYWERHAIHGIERGFEPAHQLCVVLGLRAAADLATRLGHAHDAKRWMDTAAALQRAVLDDRTGLVEGGAFIKRRLVDGGIQRELIVHPEARLHPLVPLAVPGRHWLDPDTCTALPIAFGFVPPDSPLALATLDRLELLWNQDWNDGGYGRYHVTSEADSPGGWPIASLIVARAAVDAGRPHTAWRVLQWLGEAPGAAAGSWFEFNGPRISPPAPQVGIIPWTWAELVTLLAQHVIGLRAFEGQPARLHVQPRLLPGIEHVTARFPYAQGQLRLDVLRDRAVSDPLVRVQVDGKTLNSPAALPVPVPDAADDVLVEIIVPRD